MTNDVVAADRISAFVMHPQPSSWLIDRVNVVKIWRSGLGKRLRESMELEVPADRAFDELPVPK